MSAAEVAQATLLEHCSERQQSGLPNALTVVVGQDTYVIRAYGTVHAVVHKAGFLGFPAQTMVSSRLARLPAADCMLAAKLLLEADADAFMHEARRCGSVWLD